MEEAVGPELFQDVLNKAKVVVDTCVQRSMKPVLVDPDDLHIPPMVFFLICVCFIMRIMCGQSADKVRTKCGQCGQIADKKRTQHPVADKA